MPGCVYGWIRKEGRKDRGRKRGRKDRGRKRGRKDRGRSGRIGKASSTCNMYATVPELRHSSIPERGIQVQFVPYTWNGM